MLDYVITKTRHQHNTQYLIWRPEENIREDGMLYGDGLEIIIERPKIEYVLPSDLPFGGWDKISKLPSIETIYGYKMGYIVDECGTLAMFSIMYTPPICNNIHSSKDYKYFSMGLIGFAELDTFARFKISAHAGTSMSSYGLEITKKLNSLNYLKSPKSFIKNNREKLVENDFYYVKTNPEKMHEINFNEYLLGKNFVWQTIKNIKRCKSVEEKNNICNNQMVLF